MLWEWFRWGPFFIQTGDAGGSPVLDGSLADDSPYLPPSNDFIGPPAPHSIPTPQLPGDYDWTPKYTSGFGDLSQVMPVVLMALAALLVLPVIFGRRR